MNTLLRLLTPFIILSFFASCSRERAAEVRFVREPLFEGSTGREIDLRQVAYDMKEHIRNDPEISTYDITVQVSRGLTTLNGEVKTVSESKRIEEIAIFFAPENRVINAIKIKPPVSDDELQRRVFSALSASAPHATTNIFVKASRGYVSLQGKVPSPKDIDQLLSVTLDTAGVEGVSNNLEVQ